MPPLTISTLDFPVAVRPITVDEYHAMGRAGIFGPEERVELLNGHLLPMSPVGGPHFRITNRLTNHFARHVYRDEGDLAHVSVQGPIRLDDLSEPEPDVTLLRPEFNDELEVARAPEALLVVEVSNTTLAYDRGVKRDRYAQADIPEVWIVALEGRYIETAHTPIDGVYTEVSRYTLTDERPLIPQMLPSLPPLDLPTLFRGFEKVAE